MALDRRRLEKQHKDECTQLEAQKRALEEETAAAAKVAAQQLSTQNDTDGGNGGSNNNSNGSNWLSQLRESVAETSGSNDDTGTTLQQGVVNAGATNGDETVEQQRRIEDIQKTKAAISSAAAELVQREKRLRQGEALLLDASKRFVAAQQQEEERKVLHILWPRYVAWIRSVTSLAAMCAAVLAICACLSSAGITGTSDG